MRPLLVLLLIAAYAAAEAPAPGQVEKVKEVVGPEAWALLPEWRQKMILQRYRRFLKAPPEAREEIRRGGLREHLIKPSHRFDLQELPDPLREELRRLPPEARPLAGKLVLMRLRHLRLDRNLALLPFEQRRPMFRRLFPEPFDPAQARKGHREFQRLLAKAMASRARKQLKKEEKKLGRHLSREERNRLVRALTRGEEERTVKAISKELARLRSVKPKKMRNALERSGFHLLERIQLYATPRQRELIRYASQPEKCPLLDFSWMGPRPEPGPRPEDPARRRHWDAARADLQRWKKDFQTLAWIELFTEAGFPPRIVLHLSASSSPEELFRAIQALYAGKRPPR
ncbi:MAG: hypothetical protein ACYSX0_01465 [Planctomycetota bacterium]|jgi:hypothetical protein